MGSYTWKSSVTCQICGNTYEQIGVDRDDDCSTWTSSCPVCHGDAAWYRKRKLFLLLLFIVAIAIGGVAIKVCGIVLSHQASVKKAKLARLNAEHVAEMPYLRSILSSLPKEFTKRNYDSGNKIESPVLVCYCFDDIAAYLIPDRVSEGYLYPETGKSLGARLLEKEDIAFRSVAIEKFVGSEDGASVFYIYSWPEKSLLAAKTYTAADNDLTIKKWIESLSNPRSIGD